MQSVHTHHLIKTVCIDLIIKDSCLLIINNPIQSIIQNINVDDSLSSVYTLSFTPSLPLFPSRLSCFTLTHKTHLTIQTDRPSPSLHTALLLSYFLLHLHPPHPLTLTRELEWPTRVPPTA